MKIVCCILTPLINSLYGFIDNFFESSTDPEQKTPSHKPNQGNRLLIELSKGENCSFIIQILIESIETLSII